MSTAPRFALTMTVREWHDTISTFPGEQRFWDLAERIEEELEGLAFSESVSVQLTKADNDLISIAAGLDQGALGY